MKKFNTKLFCAILALVMVFGVVVGGTIAWLTDKTETITNTFTVGNVNIDLTEATKTNVLNGTDYQFKMVPGEDITKDPKVTVEGGSEACYLFVKPTESANLDTFITYTIGVCEDGENTWAGIDTDEDGNDDVYFIEVGASEDDQVFNVLEGNKVTVNGSVTQANMNDLTTNGNNPTLSFTAYAVQKVGFANAEAAWEEAAKLG